MTRHLRPTVKHSERVLRCEHICRKSSELFWEDARRCTCVRTLDLPRSFSLVMKVFHLGFLTSSLNLTSPSSSGAMLFAKLVHLQALEARARCWERGSALARANSTLCRHRGRSCNWSTSLAQWTKPIQPKPKPTIGGGVAISSSQLLPN